MLWRDVPRGPKPPEIAHVIIETPRGSRAKFASEEAHIGMMLTKALPEGLAFPTHVGYFAQCWGDDDDPLDAFVLGDLPLYPGVVVEARPVAVMRMKDRGRRDEKVVCTIRQDRAWEHARSLRDIPRPLRESVTRFYGVYREHEGTQHKVSVEGWAGRRQALALVREGYARYDERPEAR